MYQTPVLQMYQIHTIFFTIVVNCIYQLRLIWKEIADDISIDVAISNSMSDREIERISTLIPEVLESKAEIVDNRSLYY